MFDVTLSLRYVPSVKTISMRHKVCSCEVMTSVPWLMAFSSVTRSDYARTTPGT